MFQKIKNFVGASIMYVAVKFMSLFYRKEIKEFNDKLKLAEEAKFRNTVDALKQEAAALPDNQKVLLEQYARLQNELFKIFVTYVKEIQKAKAPGEMDSVAGIWITTCEGLNKTLQMAFTHQSDDKIKAHLNALETELQLAIDTNQEVVGSTKIGGGFGYSGPMGEA